MTGYLWALRLAFAGLGVTAAAFPATIPLLAAGWGVDPSVLLPAVPLLFGGLLVGVVATILVPPRWAPRVLVAGCLAQAVALAGFAVVTGPYGLLAMAAVAGAGFGLAEASATALARKVAAAGTTTLLTQLTVLVAASAALAPLLVAVAHVPVRLLGALALLPGAAAVLATGGWRVTVGAQARSGGRLTWVIPAAVALFAYVGAESVLSGWSSVLPQRLLSLSATSAALGTTTFWSLMGTGRLLAWLALRVGVPKRPLQAGFLGVAVVAALGGALAADDGVALAMLAVTCVAIAPMYAFLLGGALEGLTADVAARATGPLVVVGSLGGAAIPALLVTSGDRAVMLWVVALLAVVGTAVAVSHGSRSAAVAAE